MHIPDGYLNIPTCVAAYGLMTPVWAVAGKKLKTTLQARVVPLLALGAAFSFVLMMFNFPLPGGSSGHAVGGGLLAILLGPWAAVSIVSIVVAIQALVFHDGGLTTLGANALNMAFVLPFTSYFVYRLLSRLLKKALAGAVAAYLGLTAAAFTTALMLGLQPHGTSGYAPYPLHITVPVMVGSHLFLFSWIEGGVTAFVLLWIYRYYPSGIFNQPQQVSVAGKAWIVLLLLILLSPLGLLTRGTAFGEWSASELTKLLGYVPEGIRKFSTIWSTPLAGYSLSNHSLITGYWLSALIGSTATALFAFVLGKWLSRGSQQRPAAPHDSEGALAVRRGPEKIPEWLKTQEVLKFSQGRKKIKPEHQGSHGLIHFFLHLQILGECQKKDGFLQKRDPRIKLTVILIFVALAAWVRSPVTLFTLLATAFMLAYTSRIPLFRYVKIVSSLTILFSLFIALPGIFQFVTPGTPWFTLHFPSLVVTKEGAAGVALFILRTTTAICWSLLLGLTTSWMELLKSLQFFKIPWFFLFVLEMAYRYIFLLVRLLEQIHFSKNARLISTMTVHEEQRWTAGRIAYLLQRSMQLSEDVYSAMTARGYEGTMKSFHRFKWDNWDKIFGAGSLFLFLLGVSLDLPAKF